MTELSRETSERLIVLVAQYGSAVARAANRIAPSVELAGMDVVEVSPPFDQAEVTAAAAHRCVLEAISALAARRRASGAITSLRA